MGMSIARGFCSLIISFWHLFGGSLSSRMHLRLRGRREEDLGVDCDANVFPSLCSLGPEEEEEEEPRLIFAGGVSSSSSSLLTKVPTLPPSFPSLSSPSLMKSKICPFFSAGQLLARADHPLSSPIHLLSNPQSFSPPPQKQLGRQTSRLLPSLSKNSNMLKGGSAARGRGAYF